jgi:hypothetical protein
MNDNFQYQSQSVDTDRCLAVHVMMPCNLEVMLKTREFKMKKKQITKQWSTIVST